jgi:sigma-B regulation protein RsbU (phosphoserine phosphatase)
MAYGRERHVIVIGDVSGKGAPAALYGAMVSGILRSLAPQKLAPPEMMRKLNSILLERKIEGHFITLTYAIWEPKAKTLHLANAGMPLPVLVRKGHAQPIRVEGVPLGLLENTDYDETHLTLEKGDLLAFYSDGLAEAAKPSHEEFGNRRMENVLRENAARPVEEIVETMFAEIARYEAGQPQRDDQTLLLIRAK